MLAIIVWLVKCSTYIMCVRVPTCLSLPPLSLSTYTLARSSLFDIPLIAAVTRLLTAGLSNPSLLSVSPIYLRQLVMSTRIVNICKCQEEECWTTFRYRLNITVVTFAIKWFWLNGTLQDVTGRNAFLWRWRGFSIAGGWARAHTLHVGKDKVSRSIWT